MKEITEKQNFFIKIKHFFLKSQEKKMKREAVKPQLRKRIYKDTFDKVLLSQIP